MKFTLDDIIGGICLGIMIAGLPWALPIFYMLATGR